MITDVTDIQAIIFLNPLRTEFFLIEKSIFQPFNFILTQNGYKKNRMIIKKKQFFSSVTRNANLQV